MELAKEIAKVNDKSSKVTKYLGQISAPWDRSSPAHKFTSKDTVYDHDFEAETYYEPSTMALKWISFLQTDTKKHFVVGIAKGGLQPTTFTDADFELVGCALGDSNDDTEDAVDFEEEEDEEDLEDLEDLEDFEEEEDLEELDEEDFDDDEEIEEDYPEEEEEEFDFEDDEEETADDDDEDIDDEEEIDDDPIDDDFSDDDLSDEDEPS
jgi:hypothetical protein